MLKENLTYTGTVMGVQENAEQFNKRTSGGGTSYCHFLQIVMTTMGNEQIEAQYCTDAPRLTEIKPNDTIKFMASKFAMNKWTIRNVEKTGTLQFQPKQVTQKDIADQAADELFEAGQSRNPMIAGTAIDRAVYNAAHFLQMKGNVSDEQFIDLSRKLYKLYLEYAQ